MKVSYFLIILLSLFIFTNCQNPSQKAANMICDCNSGLVEYTAKMKQLQAENDVNSIAEMQPEGDKLIAAAEKCLAKMEEELGAASMESKSFEVDVMEVLEKQCPEVYEAYKQVTE
jgi:spore coat protein CotF